MRSLALANIIKYICPQEKCWSVFAMRWICFKDNVQIYFKYTYQLDAHLNSRPFYSPISKTVPPTDWLVRCKDKCMCFGRLSGRWKPLCIMYAQYCCYVATIPSVKSIYCVALSGYNQHLCSRTMTELLLWNWYWLGGDYYRCIIRWLGLEYRWIMFHIFIVLSL